MKKTNLIMVTDTNEFLCQLTTEVHNALHLELKDLRKPEKQNSVVYLTRAEVAEHLKCSSSTIYRMINNGGLRSFRFGRKLLFRTSDVEAALVQLTTTKGGNYAY